MSVCPSVRACTTPGNRKAFIFNFFTQKLGGPAKQEGFHFYFFHTKIRGTSLNVHTIASQPVGASGSVVALFRFNIFFEAPLKGANSS